MRLLIGPHLGAPDADELKHAEALLARSFSRPGLAMDSPYLGWLLAERRDALPPIRVVASRDKLALVGWALGSPVCVDIDGRPADGHLVSCVAVDPSTQGTGIGRALYAALLDGLNQAESELVITFAVSGSVGERLLRTAYSKGGWHETSLGSLDAWGVLGRSIRQPLDREPPALEVPPARIIRPRETTGWIHHLSADPRVRISLGDGASAVRAHNWTDGPVTPYILVEYLPPVGDAHLLAELLDRAYGTHSGHSDRLVITNLPEWGIRAARAVGLRRMPASPYSAWCFTSPAHQTLPAPTQTTFPVT